MLLNLPPLTPLSKRGFVGELDILYKSIRDLPLSIVLSCWRRRDLLTRGHGLDVFENALPPPLQHLIFGKRQKAIASAC